MRRFSHNLGPLTFLLLGLAATPSPVAAATQEDETLRVGIIGLDTSHSIAFTREFNKSPAAEELQNCRVVAAYPHGSRDIESSVSRIPKYTEEIQQMGVEIVDSIDDLLERVDCVLLETNDGRPHLDQALQVFRAGKPVFVDKPIAASIEDTVAIFKAAEHYGVPVFSSSSLRYSEKTQAIRNGSLGRVLGCDAYSPCSLEETHPDLFWYGIHGVETLFTCMGPGCESVSRTSTPEFDVVVGRWDDGRIGTFRGIRAGKTGYGGTAFGEKEIEPLGPYGGYKPLLVEIARFFRTGEAPVDAAETIEIYAFMQAADESKARGGKPVSVAEVLERAEARAAEILEDELR